MTTRDEPIEEFLQRTVLLLHDQASKQKGSWVWGLEFSDDSDEGEDTAADCSTNVGLDDGSTVELPVVSAVWRAVELPVPEVAGNPLWSLVGYVAPEWAVGVVWSWRPSAPPIPCRVTIAMLRDGTELMVMHVDGEPPATVSASRLPRPPFSFQALRRTLGLPSGLPSPNPTELAARIHTAVLCRVVMLPDEAVPDSAALLEVLEASDRDEADRVRGWVEDWEQMGLSPAARHRGALLVTLAVYPAVAASMVAHPAVGVAAPLLSDPGSWEFVVRRAQVAPPNVAGIPYSWWAWADEAMIADLVTNEVPVLPLEQILEAAVDADQVPLEAALAATSALRPDDG